MSYQSHNFPFNLFVAVLSRIVSLKFVMSYADINANISTISSITKIPLLHSVLRFHNHCRAHESLSCTMVILVKMKQPILSLYSQFQLRIQRENLLWLFANNKGAEHLAHPRGLISAFVIG